MKKSFICLIAVMMFTSLVSCGDLPIEDAPVPVETPMLYTAEPVPSPVPTAVPVITELPISEPPEVELSVETEALPELPEQPVPAADPTVTEPVPDPTAADPLPAQPPAPVHVHDWQPVTEIIHHEAVTEEVKVVDVPATEGHFEGGSYEVMVCRCGGVFTSYDGWLTHAHAGGSAEHGGFTTDVRCDQVWVEGTPEVSHYETKVIFEAWDEELVIGTVCVSCGAVG